MIGVIVQGARRAQGGLGETVEKEAVEGKQGDEEGATVVEEEGEEKEEEGEVAGGKEEEEEGDMIVPLRSSCLMQYSSPGHH